MGRLTAPLAVLLLCSPAIAAAALLENGSFTEGRGEAPSGWEQRAWAEDASRFAWEKAADGQGMVGITNVRPNDASWCQTIAVRPSTRYRVTARVRTEDVGTTTAGAMIMIEPRVAHSDDVTGTRGWQRLALVAQSGPETRWDVCLRLGSNANLNTGTAWFTGVAVDVLDTVPTAAVPSWLAVWWRQSTVRGWTPLAAPVVAGLLLAFGFGLLGPRRTRGAPPASGAAPPPSAGPSGPPAPSAPPAEPFAPAGHVDHHRSREED